MNDKNSSSNKHVFEYKKDYGMTILESEAYRSRIAFLKAKIEAVEELRDDLKGNERAKLTRAITPLANKRDFLQARLRDRNAPPITMTPHEALANVMIMIERQHESAERTLNKIKDRIADASFFRLADVIADDLGAALSADEILRITNRLLEAKEVGLMTWSSKSMGEASAAAYVATIIRGHIDDITESLVCNFYGRSSSPVSNAKSEAKREVHSTFLRNHLRHWIANWDIVIEPSLTSYMMLDEDSERFGSVDNAISAMISKQLLAEDEDGTPILEDERAI